jgi:hypothetical protein
MATEVNRSSARNPEAWFRDALALWMEPWLRTLSFAPRNLNQPILPGWTFGPVLNVNEVNSSAPQTEAQVLQRYSYGRQLGRISDALSAIIDHERLTSDKRFEDFLEMKKDIDVIKHHMNMDTVRRLRADLAALKFARPNEYRELRDAIRDLLHDN